MEGVEAVPYSTHNDMITDLVAGRIDVVWADEIVSGYAQVKNPQPVELINYEDKDYYLTGAGFNARRYRSPRCLEQRNRTDDS